MKTDARAGITLIEILIAISLLSLLTVGMMMAMRIGFNTMEKTDNHLVRNRRVANAHKILENEIAGFMFTRAEFRPRPEVFQVVPFTQWEAHSMRFVTSYSLEAAWRGRPQIAAFQVIPGDGGIGVRLIVNETPWTGQAQAGQMVASVEADHVRFAAIVPGSGSFVLADRLAYCRFSYLQQITDPPFRMWRPDWILPMLPLGIRIEMAPLDEGPSELHASTITTFFPVNRDVGANYDDQ
ncbi:MAG: prepilin-type N-terminal cleavage/methylation domain-containing protein [Terriglobia bacterium]